MEFVNPLVREAPDVVPGASLLVTMLGTVLLSVGVPVWVPLGLVMVSVSVGPPLVEFV